MQCLVHSRRFVLQEDQPASGQGSKPHEMQELADPTASMQADTDNAPSAKPPKPVKKASAKPKTVKEEKEKKEKVPRGKNAFMHFVNDKRAGVKGEPPSQLMLLNQQWSVYH